MSFGRFNLSRWAIVNASLTRYLMIALMVLGIGAYFHHIEVMSDKTELDYHKMLGRLECEPKDFLMIGNSLKSDILPVLNLGGHAIHVPYHTTWAYEKIDFEIEHDNFKSIAAITYLYRDWETGIVTEKQVS